MKNHHPSPNRLALLLSMLAVTGHAALAPTEWQHRQSFNVAAPGLVRVDLTPASFDSAGQGQEDLRIIDAAGREIALLLDNPPIPTARRIRPADFDVKLESGATRLMLITGAKDPLAALTLETPDPFFLRAVRVEISDDNASWTTLDQGVPIFRQWGAEQTAYPSEMLEMALAHAVGTATERAYQRSTLLPKRLALMADWASYCDQVPTVGKNVIPLRQTADA